LLDKKTYFLAKFLRSNKSSSKDFLQESTTMISVFFENNFSFGGVAYGASVASGNYFFWTGVWGVGVGSAGVGSSESKS
jgi:hypothetical protein